MANAIPVGSKKPKATKVEPVAVTTPGGMDQDALLALGKSIVEAEAPVTIADDQVNQIGQERSYGRFQTVTELQYTVKDEAGKAQARTAIRVDH